MSTGTELRDQRESAGLSVEKLSALTSIRMGLISEMESNNFSHCGGDTYARGHLKNIASLLGLEPNHFVEMYNAEHSLDNRGLHDLLAENNVGSIPREDKKLSWKIPAIASVLILSTIGVVQIVMSNQPSEVKSIAAKESPTPTPTPTPSATATPSTSPTATPSESAAVSKSGSVSLTLSETRGNSFFNVVADGKSVIKGSLFQGDIKNYTAKSSISIYLSNPAGVDVTHNGKLLEPLGGQNQEVRRTFR
jgi:cytoskeletal protein RodZ